MITPLLIDDALLNEALALEQCATKEDIVITALQEFIQRRKQKNKDELGAIASFHINDDAKEEALRRGYFVLQRCGDLIHTESSEQLTVL